MRKITYIVFVFCIVLSCKKTSKIELTQKEIKPNLIGVWEMTDRYFYEKGQLKDSLKVTADRRGVKIFTQNKYMWSGKALPEAKEYFAFGTYTTTDSTFTERKEYISNAMKGHSMESTLKLILNKNTYTQIHYDSTGVYYAEKYRRIESDNKDRKTAISGVWERKYDYLYKEEGKTDTIRFGTSLKSIKIYKDGKFMWSTLVANDSTEWFAYGTYNIKDNILNESVEYSSNNMKQFGDTFSFQLIVKENEFIQIALDNQGKKHHAEHFFRVSE